MLILGPAGRLPLLPDATRYWGIDLLTPLGYRLEPDLPESTVRRAAGADAGSLVLWEDDGFELVRSLQARHSGCHSLGVCSSGREPDRHRERAAGQGEGQPVSTQQVALYLKIPAQYCRSFGGLRWAQYGEAIEFLDGPSGGRTFAFSQEIAFFLEGLYSAGDSVLGFRLALHLLYLIGLCDRASRSPGGEGRTIERIAGPFRELECPLRNAGSAVRMAVQARSGCRRPTRSSPRSTES